MVSDTSRLSKQESLPSKTAADSLDPPSKSVMEVTCAPQNDGSDDPSPEELPEHRRPPLPSNLGGSSLLSGSAVSLGAIDPEARVELLGDDEHEEGEEELRLVSDATKRGPSDTNLEAHAAAHESEHLGGVVESTVLVEQGLLLSRATVHVDGIGADEALLHLGDVQESRVGGMEEGNAKWQPDTHDPELDTGRHEGAIDVTSLDSEPVQVKQDNSAKRQGQTTDADNGHITLPVQEDHASDEDSCPCYRKADVECAQVVQLSVGRSLSSDLES